MADTRVALLRGINVGRAKRVAMADLRALVEGLGYRAVRTLLNSGNVVFTVPKAARGDPADRIARAVEDQLQVSARVTVLTAAEVAAAVAENPLLDVATDPSRLLILVLANSEARTQLTALSKQRWTPEVMALGKRVAYLWCPSGIADSPLVAAVGKCVGESGTARNLATLVKLQALCDAS
ncbi:MAG: DUF1697 domain-containing protein [Planctomycetota bacterium]